MAMRFASLEYLFKTCGDHLDRTDTNGTEIENFFVQLILVRICAEFEIRIQQLIESRGTRSNDDLTRNFMRSQLRYICKDFSIGEIGGILKRFSVDYQTNFTKNVANKEPGTSWNNIYNNRTTVAHKIGVIQQTLPELEATYRKCLSVFDELVKALELKPKELKGLL